MRRWARRRPASFFGLEGGCEGTFGPAWRAERGVRLHGNVVGGAGCEGGIVVVEDVEVNLIHLWVDREGWGGA